MILFLEINRQKFFFSEKEIIEFALWVENKKPTLEQIAGWLEKHIS